MQKYLLEQYDLLIMSRLEDVSIEALRDALAMVENKRPTQRLMIAIAYKRGVTQTELAEWYDIERKTVYNWLTRFEGVDDLVAAARDRHRSGRPRKLSDTQEQQLASTLQRSPTDVGYNQSSWTPTLVQQYIREAFEVEYSVESCRRRLEELRR